ncbi:hypothetical protein RJ639_019094, partial [Escallonia herrerae]
GQKLSEVKDLYMIEIGVYCSFNQLLERGFYHADPHPGNLLRTYDRKLAYLDFGMMGEFKQELRDGFIEACLHLVNRNYDALAKDFVTLGFIPPTADKDAVTKALTAVFQNAVSKGICNISFGDLSGNLGITMYKFKFQIPSYFSLVIRRIDRSESLLSEGAFVREILLQEFAKGLDALGLATLDFSSMTDEDTFNLRTLHRLVQLLGFQKGESVVGVEEAFYPFASVGQILPLLGIIAELPPDMQQQLLRLPADLIGKLITRVAARTVRKVFI